MSTLLNVVSRGYICRQCLALRPLRTANLPQCRSIFTTTSRMPVKSRGTRLTYRKTKVLPDLRWHKSRILSNNVPRKILEPVPLRRRIRKHLSDSPTPELAETIRTGGRKRAIRPRRHRIGAVGKDKPSKNQAEGLFPSVPSTPPPASEGVEEGNRIKSARPVRPTKHFNCYWETHAPNALQLFKANSFFINNRNPPTLLSSAARFMQVPDSDVPEVAFVGRSNVGKSSLLNAIVDASVQDLLARTSKTRGYTKTMNFYGIGPGLGVKVEKCDKGKEKIVGAGGLVIVDMPGYGEGSLLSWGVEIMKYIQSRKQLRRVFVLLDAEHGIKDKDRSLLASLRLAGVSHQVVLSKVDKLYIPKVPEIKHFQGRKAFKIKPKGTLEELKQEMNKLRPEIKPPHSAGALGEMLACSSEVVVNGKRLGVDHVRFAVLRAVGLEGRSK